MGSKWTTNRTSAECRCRHKEQTARVAAAVEDPVGGGTKGWRIDGGE